MNIILFILLIVILSFGFYGLYRQYIFQNALKGNYDSKLMRKILYYRNILNEKQVVLLLMINILLVIGLVFNTISIYKMENTIVDLQKLTQTYYESQKEKIHEVNEKVSDKTSSSSVAQSKNESPQSEDKKKRTPSLEKKSSSQSKEKTKDASSSTK